MQNGNRLIHQLIKSRKPACVRGRSGSHFKSSFCAGWVCAATLLTGCASLNANLGALKEDISARLNTDPAPVAAQTAQSVTTAASDWVEYAPDLLPTTNWVAQLDDRGLAPLVNEALLSNTNVAAAAARWDAAQASARAASGNRKPSVSFGSRASHSEYGNDLIGDSNSLSLGPSVSWEADLWGRLGDTVNAADIEAGASAADLAAARLSIAGQVSQSWFDLIESKLLLDLAQKNLDTLERSLRLTERRFERGLTQSSDVRLSRSSVASARASLASREQLRAASARRLEVLLRRYPAGQLKAAFDLPPLPTLEGAGIPSDILQRRPDLIAAERRLLSQGLRIDIARKNLLPRLTLSGDGNLSAGTLRDLLDIDALVANIVSNLTAPIYQGGALKAEVERNEAQLRAQIETYAGTVLQAYLEVENALDAEQLLQAREAALRESLIEAQKAEERLALRYAEGLATILQLLDSQTRAINAESALIGARKERLANRVRLHLALGGGQFGALPN